MPRGLAVLGLRRETVPALSTLAAKPGDGKWKMGMEQKALAVASAVLDSW